MRNYPHKIKGYLISLTALLLIQMVCLQVNAQNIDLENIGKDIKAKIQQKKNVSITGGVNLSSVFYNGNAGSGRDPFSYILSGNVGLRLYGVSIPASFTFTNRGFSYNYSYPHVPNWLSLHPKYKWVTGHIGDITMNFSPYTLSSVLITGVGADLAPKSSKFKYSLVYGRLQKAVEYRPDNGNTLATYKRMGYGAKVGYDNGAYKAGVSLFMAKDDLNSLNKKPDSLQIYPQQNTSISFEGSFPVIKNLVLKTEYGISVLTKDLRAPKVTDSNSVGSLINLLGGRLSSSLYKALKSELTYTIGSSMLGAGYERIDPGYQTLGAYYFTNDVENITAIFAQSLFKGKINLSGNYGIQRDDLDKRKSGSSSRTVGSINISFVGSKRFTGAFTYSNFQTYTNVKQQFQYINQQTPFDNLDTLNFRQLSQNSNLNINYIVSDNKDKPKNLNVNLSVQDSYDMQGGIIVKGNASRFYNFAGGYNITNNPKAMNISTAFNLTYNKTGGNNSIILGPTVSINKKLFGKKVNTGFSVSYNNTFSPDNTTATVVAFRINGGYVWKKKHNFGINAAGMTRGMKGPSGKKSMHDFTETITYSYSF